VRAATLAAPGVVEVADFPIHEIGPGQLLVRMHYAAICGSDVHMVYDRMHDPARIGTPGYPGHEGIGVVTESRSGHVPVGTAVLTVPLGRSGGCFAEYQQVDDTQVVPLPDGADLRRLLLAQQLGTTIYAMRKFTRALVEPPEHVAVLGAGAAGLFFVQLARQAGCRSVVVSDLSEERLALAATLGASATVLAPQHDLVAAVRDCTAGAGADLVIEAAGYDRTRADAVEAAREHGTVGLFGYPERHGRSPFPVERAFRRSLTLEWISGTQQEPGLRSFREAVGAIRSGAIAVDHCLTCMYDLDRAPEALQRARDLGRGVAKVGFAITG